MKNPRRVRRTAGRPLSQVESSARKLNISLLLLIPGISSLRLFVLLYCSTILSDPRNLYYSYSLLFVSCFLVQVILVQCVIQRHLQLLSLVDIHALECLLSSYLLQTGYSPIAVVFLLSCFVPFQFVILSVRDYFSLSLMRHISKASGQFFPR